MSNRNPNHQTWTKQAGIVFATPEQHSTAQIMPSSSNICIHFSRGHCKFGNKCKKSHDLTAPLTQTGPNSNNTEQLNVQLRKLFVGLERLNVMSSKDMLYGGKLDQFVEFINDHVASIKQTLIFTPSGDVSQSLFSHEQVQNMAKSLDIWWKRIAGGLKKSNNLYTAIHSLDLVVRSADQKMAQDSFSDSTYLQNGTSQLPKVNRGKKGVAFANFVPQGNYSNVNYFQNGTPQPMQGNKAFQNNVSKNARGKNKKRGNARSAGYASGDNNMYNYWNAILKNSQNFNPNIAKNNNLYMNNSGNSKGKSRRGILRNPNNNGNGNNENMKMSTNSQIANNNRPQPRRGGRGRGKRN
jgi:hypothetical protein